MATNFKNRCIYKVETTGTGTITLGSVLSTFFELVADDDGKTFNYVIIDNEDCEIGEGVYSHVDLTFTRNVEQSTNDNSPINLSGIDVTIAIGGISENNITPLNLIGVDSGNLLLSNTKIQSDNELEALTVTYTGDGRRAVNIEGGDLDVGGGKGCITTSGEVHIHGVGTMNDEDTEELKLRWNEEDEIYQILTAKHGLGSLRGLEIQSKGLTVRGHESGDVPLRVEGEDDNVLSLTGSTLKTTGDLHLHSETSVINLVEHNGANPVQLKWKQDSAGWYDPLAFEAWGYDLFSVMSETNLGWLHFRGNDAANVNAEELALGSQRPIMSLHSRSGGVAFPGHVGIGNNKHTGVNTAVLSVKPGSTVGDTAPNAFAIQKGDTIAFQVGRDGDTSIFPQSPTAKALVLQASAAQTANLFEAQDSAGNVGARITAAGEFSNSNNTRNEKFGEGSSTSSDYTRQTAIGAVSSTAAGYATSIGADSRATGQYATAIGASARADHYNSIALGRSSQTTASRQIVAGYSTLPYRDVYIGNGVTDASPESVTYHATGGEGENIVGANLLLAPGKSTGNATPASVIIRSTTSGSSGTAAQTLVDTLTVRDNKVGIGTSEPQSQLHVAPKDATTKGLVIQGSAAQTENLLEVQNSAGSVLAGVDSNGMLDATNFRAIRLTRSIPAGEGNYAMLGTFSDSGQRGKVLLVSVSQASGSGKDTSAIWLLATSSYDRGWHTVGPVASSQYNVRAELDVVVWPNGTGNLSLRLRNTSEDTALGPLRVVIQVLAGRIADDWNESTDTGTTTRPPVAPYHPLWVEDGKLGVGKASPTEKLDVSGSVAISDQLFISDKAQFDADTTAGNTRLILYDVDSEQLQRVKVGPDGSGPGGTGRALYIDNNN